MLLRGARWAARAQGVFGILFVVLTAVGFSGGITSKGAVSWLVIWTAMALGWFWRARRMGVRIGAEGLIVVRPFDSVTVRWEEVERFSTRPIRSRLWRGEVLQLERRAVGRESAPDPPPVALPTLGVPALARLLGRRLGPADALYGERPVPAGGVLALLDERRLAAAADQR